MITNTFTTPATGNSYIDQEEADAALVWSELWRAMTDEQKEERIVAVSKRLGNRIFIGTKANDPQPMAFPRTISGDQDYLGADAQQIACRTYCLAMLEYQLSKVPIGVLDYTLADEHIKHAAVIEPGEAKNALFDFCPQR